MLSTFIKSFPLILTFTATFGVLVHDMKIDRATTVALALPTALISFVALDSTLKSSEHVHTERISAPRHVAVTPRIRPRDDDRRYTQSKKISSNSMGSGYMWPSI